MSDLRRGLLLRLGAMLAATLVGLIPSAMAAAAPAASAAVVPIQRLAIIDLKNVFENYFKTKAADATLKERAGEFDKEKKTLVDDYKKLTEDYKLAVEDANNPALSSEERDKRKTVAEGKLVQIREMEQTITQFDRQAMATLEEQETRMRGKILEEIQVVVDEQARSGNYSLVFDVASESRNRTPVILFSSGQDDLTQGVLKALNAKAPTALPGALNP